MDNAAYAEHLEKAVDAHFFQRGSRFTTKDWDALLGHCAAITDLPLVGFWRELYETYPDAKIVLVERDEDAWYKSLSEAVVEPFFTRTSNITRLYLEPLVGSRLGEIAYKSVTGFLGAKDEAGIKSNMRTLYRRHYKEVRETVPEDRLLEFDMASGWEPLCQFLSKPVPDCEFPRVNETDAVKKVFETYKRRRLAELGNLILSRAVPATLFVLVAAVTVLRFM